MSHAVADHAMGAATYRAPETNSLEDDYTMFSPARWAKRPTVMQVLPALVSGGVERGTVDIAKALVSAGWEAIVVSGGGTMTRELGRIGARHVTLPVGSKNPFGWRATFDALVDLVHVNAVDIVHARSRMPAWLASGAARRNRVPFVTTFHGRYGDAGGIKAPYNKVMVRADRVIAISHFVAGDIARRYRFDTDRIRIIPRGIDFDLFDPDRVSAERMIRLADRWRLPDGVPVVLLPGRLTRWKGHEVLIDALNRLADLEVHCVFIGDHAGKERYRDALEARARRLGLAANVFVAGLCDDMPAAYKLADVVVSASLDPEPFGRVAVEGQAMGRPVVATNRGGGAETVRDGETGWLVPPGDVDALAGAIRQALSLGEVERARLAQAAIAHVRADYAKHTMCARTLAVYEEVLPGSRHQRDAELGIARRS